MVCLQSIPGTELNEYVIKLLKPYEITTVLKFLIEDTIKLSKYTNIPNAEIDILKIKLVDIFSPRGICAINICNIHNSFPIFSTGINSLDKILDGGFSDGNIIEICGLPGIGKSLFCSTLSINFANKYQFEIIYLDTKNNFSGIRIYKILNELKYSKDDIGKIMEKIKVERIYEPKDLLNTLKCLMEYIKKPYSKIKLLIIDSIPAIGFSYHNEKSFIGKSWLTKICILLRRLANEHKLIVITVNILTRWNEDLDEIDSIKSQTIIKPSLGKYWETVPTIRFQLEELTILPISSTSNSNILSDNSNTNNVTINTTAMISQNNQRRKLKIIRSDFYRIGISCIINITDNGGIF